MKNNNGKIAIAIVAMFVVALSIVGVTYAYFTAAITENDSEAKEVEVLSGSMEVDYTGGKTFTVSNILPNWSNDGDKYYDTVASATYDDASGETRYIAASKASVASPKPYGAGELTGDKTEYTDADFANAGLTEPITFSVKNTGKNPAAVKVEMEILANSVNTTGDIKYDVYAVDVQGDAEPNFGSERIVSEKTLGAADTTDFEMIEPNAKVAVGYTRHYKIVFTYISNGNQSSIDNNQQNKTFSTELHVTGLDQTAAAE